MQEETKIYPDNKKLMSAYRKKIKDLKSDGYKTKSIWAEEAMM